MTETREVQISNGDGGVTPGILHVHHLSGGKRAMRGLAALGICWGVGAVTVIIPLIHFVLPPVMLVLGPVMAWRRYAVRSLNEKVEGTCPTCGRPMTIELDGSEAWPYWTYCPPSDNPICVVEGRRGHVATS